MGASELQGGREPIRLRKRNHHADNGLRKAGPDSPAHCFTGLVRNNSELATMLQDDPSEASQTRVPRVQGFFAHHGVWAPGVRVFRQLTFRSKAILISIVFLIPIVALSIQYGRQSTELLRSNENAKVGITYASEVLPLLKLLQQQRSAILQQGGAESGGAQVKAMADAIGLQFKRVVELDQQHGELLRTKEALEVLRANMEKAAAQQGSKNLLAMHKRQSQSIEAALALLDAALDGSGLTLDSDPDTNRLMQTGLAQLPRLTEASLAVDDLGLAVVRGANPQMGAKMMSPLRAIGVYLDGQTRVGLDKLVAAHPELAQRIAYASTQEAMARVDELVGGLGEEGWKAEPAALVSAREAVADRANSLQAAIVAELRLRQQARSDRIWLERGLLLSLLTAAMLLASYLFISFSRVMQGGLNEVRRHLRAMTGGDLTTSPNPWGKDEAARLMLDLRAMQDSLRDIVSQVRVSSEGIVSASLQIASGASELSSRTEQTASSLQRSAASLEQIGTTVRQTADDAGQATGIGKESADAAVRGGEVIGRVNSTMHDIRNSSSKIGEIIGVIDGIAFQTNILALNAAVEAARAGEAGRGFAVVAAEVRSLAQRSASAAREIKSLVGGSLDKVNNGVSVVQDASTAMNAIVSAAKRVNDLLDGIAIGTREQARGVTEIGTAVNEVDLVTQQNSALVEETAAAAAALEDQARMLVERVSRFRLPEASTDGA